jgi:hypothetical protein
MAATFGTLAAFIVLSGFSVLRIEYPTKDPSGFLATSVRSTTATPIRAKRGFLSRSEVAWRKLSVATTETGFSLGGKGGGMATRTLQWFGLRNAITRMRDVRRFR